MQLICRRIRPSARTGFTVMELLISAGVLTVLITAFGQIVSITQNLIAESQAAQRMNSIAVSVMTLLRNDIDSVTRAGFLDISGDTMIIARTGQFQSAYDPNIRSTGAAIVYKLVNNTSPDSTQQIAIRGVQILYNGPTPTTAVDVEKKSLGDIAYADGASVIGGIKSNVDSRTNSISIPPQRLDQTRQICNVLISHCSQLSFTALPSGTGGPWTSTTKKWPSIIRIQFTIHDPQGPHRSRSYELICALPIS